MFKLRRLLVPVDFSKESELALDWAMMMARANPDCSIHLLHVVQSDILIPGGGSDTSANVDVLREGACKRLREWQARIPEAILSVTALREGHVSDQIVDLCRERRIDLVIMTTHGRRALSHGVRGSVAEETVREASCPVLVLHLNQTAIDVVHSAA